MQHPVSTNCSHNILASPVGQPFVIKNRGFQSSFDSLRSQGQETTLFCEWYSALCPFVIAPRMTQMFRCRLMITWRPQLTKVCGKKGIPNFWIPFNFFFCLPEHNLALLPFSRRCQHYFCESCAIQQFRKTRRCYACGADTEGVFKPAKQLEERLKGGPSKDSESGSDCESRGSEEGQLSSSDDDDEDWFSLSPPPPRLFLHFLYKL